MIKQKDLAALLIDLESDRVERTVSTTNTDKFAQAICAFANDMSNNQLPGYLIIGVDDNGKVKGLKITDQLLQNLSALRSDGNIQPLPTLSVAKFSFEEREIAVVEVMPSDLPPVRYKGTIWIRVGPRKAIANEQEERLLTEKRISKAHSFDASPCSASSIQDLALSLFGAYRQEVVAAEIITANHRSLEEQLSSLRFYNPRLHCPTYAGLLLFGKNPRFFLPGAYVQYLKMPSTTLTDLPLEQAEISGDLLGILRELDTRVKINISAALQPITALREKVLHDFPEVAVRELLLNAIMHRDYQSNTPIRFYWFEDRIEVQNPGGLYGEVTRETMAKRNSYRNPVVAEAMKALGYVNRFGYGIQRAQAALRENGNPPAEFEVDDRTVLVTIRKGLL